jgi:hypothetical protein
MALAMPAPGFAQSRASVDIGGIRLEVAAPAGWCLETPDRVETSLGNDPQSMPVAALAPCDQIAKAVGEADRTFPASAVLMMPRDPQRRAVQVPREQVVAMFTQGMQRLVAQQGGPVVGDDQSLALDPRALGLASEGPPRFLGVFRPDANGAYFGLALLGRDDNREHFMVGVTGITAVRGRVVHYTLFQPYDGADSVKDAVMRAREHLALFVSLND